MEVHKVVAPPRKSTAAKLKTRLKETFFPDDPLRQFRGQPNRIKLIRAAQYIFPILQWCPEYSFRLLKSDVVSGLTIASLAIPQVRTYDHFARSDNDPFQLPINHDYPLVQFLIIFFLQN